VNSNLLLIAKGDKYIDILIKNYKLIPNNYNLIIYTSNVDRVKFTIKTADVREYSHDVFRYFDKVSLTYDLTKEKNKPVLFIDVGRIAETNQFIWKLDINSINDIHHMGNWGKIKTAFDLKTHESEYFEKSYWDNILSYMSSNIDLKKIPTILERMFVFPYNKKMEDFIIEFEKLRPLFEHASVTKKNVYSGIGNGEGLAFGYSAVKTNTPIIPLSITTKIKTTII
tara:strand:- start:1443 stop:2120 length:678 start_codon:yes stop_codon:yes gene_type:complete